MFGYTVFGIQTRESYVLGGLYSGAKFRRFRFVWLKNGGPTFGELCFWGFILFYFVLGSSLGGSDWVNIRF